MRALHRCPPGIVPVFGMCRLGTVRPVRTYAGGAVSEGGTHGVRERRISAFVYGLLGFRASGAANVQVVQRSDEVCGELADLGVADGDDWVDAFGGVARPCLVATGSRANRPAVVGQRVGSRVGMTSATRLIVWIARRARSGRDVVSELSTDLVET
jgi:hypothetical protein